jgi:eukaryotic-like serine/threonine-protein kinase
MHPAPLHRHRFGSAEFDEARFELRVGGLLVELQTKPLQLLALLLATPGEVVLKDRIFALLWNDRATGDAVLANAASKLRTALGADNARAIVTVPRQGYRLDGAVERTALGRRQPALPLVLAPGQAVPGRAGHRLVRPLGPRPSADTWLAEQPRSGDRRVFKFALDGERLADLKREVTLARVLHESLGEREDFVPVLDWRFDQPPYWVEMAWAGDSLEHWAPQHLHRTPHDERLKLVLQLADTLAAAHSAAVLHRDLKPGNVLIEPLRGAEPGRGPWQLRLTDFGSGRLLDAGQLERLRVTRLGMTVDGADATSGTPYYIAPELLAGGAPSTASDVFALGVMLFQLLAGDLRRPLLPGWERTIDDPLLREDIAAATDIDPTRRLSAAAELAQRLRQLPERRAERERSAQEALENEAVRALNRLLREDLLAAANPALQGRADATVAEALTGAAERIDTKYAALPAAVRGSLHAAMQQALSELSRAQEAVQAGRRAVATLQDPAELADARLRLALDLVQLSQLQEASEVVAALDAQGLPTPAFQARLLFVKAWLVSGDGSAHAALALLEQAAALVLPLGAQMQAFRGVVLVALADNLAQVGRHAEAETAFRSLLDEQVASHGPEHPRPAYTQVGLANTLVAQGRLEEAHTLLAAAAPRLAARLGAAHRHTLTARDLLAEVKLRRGDAAGAAADWREVEAGFAALLGAGSSYTLSVTTHRARALHAAGQAQAAEALLAAALQSALAFQDASTPQAQQIRCALAACKLDLGRAAEAAPLLAGLDAAALSLAQPEPDWPARLAALRKRVAAATSCT